MSITIGEYFFTDAAQHRLEMFRSAVQAGFYNEGDGELETVRFSSAPAQLSCGHYQVDGMPDGRCVICYRVPLSNPLD